MSNNQVQCNDCPAIIYRKNSRSKQQYCDQCRNVRKMLVSRQKKGVPEWKKLRDYVSNITAESVN